MKDIIPRLINLGFSMYEAKAYLALLRENPLTAYEIAKYSGVPSSKIYEVIRKLETRHVIQSVHGEGSKMYVPLSPEEFIKNFRMSVEENLRMLNSELKDLKGGMDTSYTWHINDYESLLLKARRMIDTARDSILLSVWSDEFLALGGNIVEAESRGIKIAIIHYGTTNIKAGTLYRHPPEDTLFARRGVKGFALVVDSKEVLTGKIGVKETQAIWSMNEGFVVLAEDYIRHDVYVMKIVERFDPLLKQRFGYKYEKLIDVFTDDKVS
jgi:sugar-specific transcriptional regulator TrmB